MRGLRWPVKCSSSSTLLKGGLAIAVQPAPFLLLGTSKPSHQPTATAAWQPQATPSTQKMLLLAVTPSQLWWHKDDEAVFKDYGHLVMSVIILDKCSHIACHWSSNPGRKELVFPKLRPWQRSPVPGLPPSATAGPRLSTETTQADRPRSVQKALPRCGAANRQAAALPPSKAILSGRPKPPTEPTLHPARLTPAPPCRPTLGPRGAQAVRGRAPRYPSGRRGRGLRARGLPRPPPHAPSAGPGALPWGRSSAGPDRPGASPPHARPARPRSPRPL